MRPGKLAEPHTSPVYTGSLGPVAQLVEQGTFNPKVAGSRPARPIKEVPAHQLLPHVGNDVLGRWVYRWVYGNRPRQTGKAPSILAAWSFRSARSQWP
jgi:hypothetical protein